MNNGQLIIEIRFATPDDLSLIYRFIQKKAEFDRSVGAYSGNNSDF